MIHVDLATYGAKQRIAIVSDMYHPEINARIKSINGRKFHPEDKTWSVPLDMTSCHRLRQEFGDDLDIGRALNRWARAELASQARVLQMSSASDWDLSLLPDVAPVAAAAMATRTYQRSGAAFVAETRAALVADEVGLGKTLIAIGGVIEAGNYVGSHLVVANKTALQSVWGNEIEKWTDGKAFVMPEGRPKRIRKIHEFMNSDAPSKWLVVNKEMLRTLTGKWCKQCGMFEEDTAAELLPGHYQEGHRTQRKVMRQEWPELFEVDWASQIVDEAHRSLSSGNRSAANRSQTAEGLLQLRSRDDAVKIAVTGTPFRGRERALWGILNWLRPDLYGGFWKFAEAYLEVKEDRFSKTIVGLRPDAVEAFNGMLNRHALRRTRAEVRADLPARDPQDHWVDMEGKHLKQYEQWVEQGVAKMDSGTLESVGLLAELTRMRQFSWGVWDMDGEELVPTMDSPKYRLLRYMLDQRGVVGKKDAADGYLPAGVAFKYIIATQFTRLANGIRDALEADGIRTALITGAVTGKDRAAVVADFQANGDPSAARVLIMNSQAGGESITLDRYCDEMFILDETFIADDQEQLEGRIDNRETKVGDGRTRSYHYIRTRQTVEENMANINMAQRDLAVTLLDRRRGLEVAKRILKGLEYGPRDEL